MKHVRAITLSTLLATFVLAGLALVACGSSETATQDISYTLTATKLAKAYNANAVAANGKYKGKTISVSGTAGDIGTELLGRPYVMLETSDPLLPQIQCVFEDGQKDVVAGITKGDSVTVVGKVEGILGFVEMSGCTLK